MSKLASLKVALLFVALIFSPLSWALDRNGNWWLTQTGSDRVTYIVGFFDGIEFELDRANLELTNMFQATLYPQPCDDACTKLRLDQAFTNWRNLLKGYDDFNGVTAGQLVAGLDAMYADYRNRTIMVKDVLSVVMWSIKGIDQKSVDARLTYLRSQK